MSNTKVKGLLKGLRYISQIFDPNGKEPELQIGHPTDVVHVIHIGCDDAFDPSSLIGGFEMLAQDVDGTVAAKGETSSSRTVVSSPRETSIPPCPGPPQLPKPRRNRSAPAEPTRDPPRIPKPITRRGSGGADTTSMIINERSGRGTRRMNATCSKERDDGTEFSWVEPPAGPRQPWQRKLSKESSLKG